MCPCVCKWLWIGVHDLSLRTVNLVLYHTWGWVEIVELVSTFVSYWFVLSVLLVYTLSFDDCIILWQYRVLVRINAVIMRSLCVQLIIPLHLNLSGNAYVLNSVYDDACVPYIGMYCTAKLLCWALKLHTRWLPEVPWFGGIFFVLDLVIIYGDCHCHVLVDFKS